MITADFTGDVAARPAVVEYGDVLTLNCTASGGPDNMFYWFKDNVFLEVSNFLNITTVSAADGGLYECVVNNTAGSSTANITVNGKSCLLLSTPYVTVTVQLTLNFTHTYWYTCIHAC